MNGLHQFILSIALFAFAVYRPDVFNPGIIVDNFGGILMTAQIFTLCLCVFLYLKGFIFRQVKRSLVFLFDISQGNPTGNVIVDFFYGYEVNPRIFGIIYTDFKFFTESRALITWVMFDLCFVYKQYTEYVQKSITLNKQ